VWVQIDQDFYGLVRKKFSLIVAMSTGSDDKLKNCLELGADVGINYKKEDFVERAKAETDGKGLHNLKAVFLLELVAGCLFCIHVYNTTSRKSAPTPQRYSRVLSCITIGRDYIRNCLE